MLSAYAERCFTGFMEKQLLHESILMQIFALLYAFSMKFWKALSVWVSTISCVVSHFVLVFDVVDGFICGCGFKISVSMPV